MKPFFKQRVKKQFAKALELPPTVVLDCASVNLIGREEARIQNHKGLLQYTDRCIKARSFQGAIELKGENLEITFFSAQEIHIFGRINQVMLK
ncbi:MAG: sporulation protein YqfC [Firmicutes bacterium]|nr:sporulation protein YqfC [Bacillota bacterium]